MSSLISVKFRLPHTAPDTPPLYACWPKPKLIICARTYGADKEPKQLLYCHIYLLFDVKLAWKKTTRQVTLY